MFGIDSTSVSYFESFLTPNCFPNIFPAPIFCQTFECFYAIILFFIPKIFDETKLVNIGIYLNWPAKFVASNPWTTWKLHFYTKSIIVFCASRHILFSWIWLSMQQSNLVSLGGMCSLNSEFLVLEWITHTFWVKTRKSNTSNFSFSVVFMVVTTLFPLIPKNQTLLHSHYIFFFVVEFQFHSTSSGISFHR